jgi:hypothetical protein
MTQTPMQEAIEDIKFLAEKAKDPLSEIAYGMAITILELHQPKERQMVIDAFNELSYDIFNDTIISGEDYYNKTFKQ